MQIQDFKFKTEKLSMLRKVYVNLLGFVFLIWKLCIFFRYFQKDLISEIYYVARSLLTLHTIVCSKVHYTEYFNQTLLIKANKAVI